MPSVDTKHSIVIKKEGSYRDGTKVWSNRYHFEGDLPTNPTEWETLADNIVDAEKTCYISAETIIEAIGYDAGSATVTNPHGDSVYTKTYTTAGTFVPAGTDVECPGDCAILVRYNTPARTTKNHPVYLFNYYHNAHHGTISADRVATDQSNAFDTYAGHWVSGFSDGSTTRERCGPRGAVAIGKRVDPFVRHRDFPS